MGYSEVLEYTANYYIFKKHKKNHQLKRYLLMGISTCHFLISYGNGESWGIITGNITENR